MSQKKRYKRQEIIKMCEEAAKNMAVFYSQSFVNYRDVTIDSQELPSEIISGYLCEHIEYFDNISCITREKSYETEGHLGIYDDKSNREEEKTAMRLFNHCQECGNYPYIGKILDYQTPLKNRMSDKAGKIDLLSINGDTLFILELKKKDSSETMLRCVLESYTYLKTVDESKLISDFGLSDIKNFRAAPFVYMYSRQWKDLHSDEENENLKALMSKLGIEAYYLVDDGDDYLISKDS